MILNDWNIVLLSEKFKINENIDLWYINNNNIKLINKATQAALALQ